MKKSKKLNKCMIIAVIVVLAAIYYYFALPAINIHNASIWKFIIAIPVILLILYVVQKFHTNGGRKNPVQAGKLLNTALFKRLALSCCCSLSTERVPCYLPRSSMLPVIRSL